MVVVMGILCLDGWMVDIDGVHSSCGPPCHAMPCYVAGRMRSAKCEVPSNAGRRRLN